MLSKYGNCARPLKIKYKRLFLHIMTGNILDILSAFLIKQLFHSRLLDIYRILHGKCVRTVFYARVVDVSEIERVRSLIQKQRVRKYSTKHFPCSIVFITYILRHSSFCQPFISNLPKF